MQEYNFIINGNAECDLGKIPDGVVQMCVTSPPYYGLRDYGMDEQIGLEESPDAYIERLVGVFREVKRVLRDDGTLWVNLGDTYNAYKANTGDTEYAGFSGRPEHKRGLAVSSLKNKDLIGIPWMLAFALRADGWYLRQDIIWRKGNPMPESVKDRCTKSHEYLFLLSKSPRYYYDADAIAEPCVRPFESGILGGQKGLNTKLKASDPNYRGGNEQMGNIVVNGATRNKRSVWDVNTKPFRGAHFAVFPPELIIPCILAGSREGDVVLDPFMGSVTTAEVAMRLDRQYLGVELNPDYIKIANERLKPLKERLF